MTALVSLLFFLSGATALVYQVVWARALAQLFGGSHLAVTTVLSVVMAGLAVGGRIFGRRADRFRNGLRAYGYVEIGIGVSALVFIALTKLSPSLYGPLSRAVEDRPAVLTALRVLFALAALAVPTTLMGGTLPLLAGWANGSGGGAELRGRGAAPLRRLSLLYAVNTFGAAAGALAGGFVLLRFLGLLRTTLAAAVVNVAIGLVAILLSRRRAAPGAGEEQDAHRTVDADGPTIAPTIPWQERGAGAAVRSREEGIGRGASGAAAAGSGIGPGNGPRLALAGIALSGACALGYEVLWTRMLGLALGTSVYNFAVILAAFLAGIGLGSQAFGLLRGRARRVPGGPTFARTASGAPAASGAAAAPKAARVVLAFAAAQIAIGATALGATWGMSDLPLLAARAQSALFGARLGEFGSRLGASVLLAFAFMLLPAFFMGISFPLAAEIVVRVRAKHLIGPAHRSEWSHARHFRDPALEETGAAGDLVGRILFWNTVGAVVGASVSGLALVPWLGVERSLLLLSAVNVASGIAIAGAIGRPAIRISTALAGLGAVLFVLAAPRGAGLWDPRIFAIYRNNQREAFDTPEHLADAIENTEILYAHDGVNETISVIRPKGADQALLVNGRVEASTTRVDRQCQAMLGHLPMLLHPRPRRVFVLGLGTGMTLGATSVHPLVERLTLAELEPGVVPAARTFSRWNHAVLEDPRLRIVFDDGRNVLRTSRESYDVVTADPIHPWSAGGASLYTAEAFRTVAERLAPGGIVCQWLPIYELSAEDLRCVVGTFLESFPHATLWLSHYDAALVGSRAPFVIDPGEIERRIAASPSVAADLSDVEMGSAADLLSYFVMGTGALRAFAGGAAPNTDDNLRLEFSAPRSMGVARLAGDNVSALAARRERVDPYLAGPGRGGDAALADPALARAYDRAHALFLLGGAESGEFQRQIATLESMAPRYAPARFLLTEYRDEKARTPAPIASASFRLRDEAGGSRLVEITAVAMRVGATRAAVVLVDNDAREIYGQIYIDGADEDLDAKARVAADEALAAMREAYAREAAAAGGDPPAASARRSLAAAARAAAARGGDSRPRP